MLARVARHASGERSVHRRARRRVRRSGSTPLPRPALFVDAASLAYRAYHAVPEWRAPDGTLVNAALGFLNFLSRLVPDRKPARLFVALDADWRPQFRVDAMPSYKSHRVAGPDDPPDPGDPQMKIIVELLDAFRISTAAADGYEAQAVIASRAERLSGPAGLVTGRP